SAASTMAPRGSTCSRYPPARSPAPAPILTSGPAEGGTAPEGSSGSAPGRRIRARGRGRRTMSSAGMRAGHSRAGCYERRTSGRGRWNVDDRVIHRDNPDLGVGRVAAISGRAIDVVFPDAGTTLRFRAGTDALAPAGERGAGAPSLDPVARLAGGSVDSV